MNRDEQEMIMWRRVYERWYAREGYEVDTCGDIADAAVAEFRKRYPVEPDAPEPTAPGLTWYDEPPRPGEYHVAGLPHVCWVDEDVVYFPEWDRDGERPRIREMSRAGRRVSRIAKPQEPTP